MHCRLLGHVDASPDQRSVRDPNHYILTSLIICFVVADQWRKAEQQMMIARGRRRIENRNKNAAQSLYIALRANFVSAFWVR